MKQSELKFVIQVLVVFPGEEKHKIGATELSRKYLLSNNKDYIIR